MAEYIEKDKLRLMKTEECAGHTIEYAMGWKACIDWLKTIPAANVRENVTGEWMQVKDGDWAGGGKTVCSQCQYGYSWKMYFEVERFNFCPNCGAKMEVNDVRS